MTKPDFSQINRSAANSFNVQRRIIRDMCMGKEVNCPECHQKLVMIGPSSKSEKESRAPGIYCDKGCTSIELEFEAE